MTELILNWFDRGNLYNKFLVIILTLMTLFLTGKENINLIYNELIQLPILESLLSVPFLEWYILLISSLFIINLTNGVMSIIEINQHKKKISRLNSLVLVSLIL